MTAPLWTSIEIALASTFLCWLVSVLTGNFSQVDRLWSLLPPVYAIWFASRAGSNDRRLHVIAMLITLWGARLTFNFARKGGYRWTGEDYRWPVLRKRMGPIKFQLFNATFIAPYQNFLLWTLGLPAYVSLRAGTPLNALDLVATALLALALIGETLADQQQWDFHQDKLKKLARGEEIKAPFLTTGLFRYSRHPNFFCEQTIWWCVYLFSVAATGRWWNLGLIGPTLLTLLFLGSSRFTEELTLAKYPAYAEYQKKTSRQLPWLPRGD